MIKGKPCTICGEPDDYSDETVCHNCIGKWKKVLEGKERERILQIIEKDLDRAENLIQNSEDINGNRNHWESRDKEDEPYEVRFMEVKDWLGNLILEINKETSQKDEKPNAVIVAEERNDGSSD